MSYHVYILFSQKFNKHYTGFTSDLQTRLKSHNEFGRGWTTRFRPWKLIFSKQFESKQEAMKFEKWLKTGKGREFINSLNHQALGFISAAADLGSTPDPATKFKGLKKPFFIYKP